MSCGIWRYHPQSKEFELIARGSTNPWGLDWDENGEMFMSGNVNGHLWHVIPGAYLERMHPTTKTPYVYERLTMSADQPHYLGTANWKRDWNRGLVGRDGESDLGGGHSHCGAMIYLGDQWPEPYQGLMFMANTHGRRVNIDALAPRGSSFVGTYQGDFLRANQSWFRGVSLLYGPDGAVYLSDWTDDGECHDHDGVHRTSGRIYRITHGQSRSWQGDLSRQPDADLLNHLHHPNAWFRRQSRRLLHERAVAGTLDEKTWDTLQNRLHSSVDKNARLQALWALHVTGGLGEDHLLEASRDDEAALRAWAVRLFTDRGPASAKAIARMVAMARSDPSPLVRLHLASAAQRVPANVRTPLLIGLAHRSQDHEDAVLQRMLWYALEPALAASPELAGSLIPGSSDRLASLIARRLMEPDLAGTLARDLTASLLAEATHPSLRSALFEGALKSLQKDPDVRLPASWSEILDRAMESADPVLRQQAIRLAMVIQHAPTLRLLIASVENAHQAIEERLRDLEPLLTVRHNSEIDALCQSLLHQGPPPLRRAVIPSLPRRTIPNWEPWLLEHWSSLDEISRSVAVEALATRSESALLLVKALADGRIERREISASQAQKLAAMKQPELSALLETHWGSVQQSSEAKLETINRYRALVSTSPREPDRERGRQIYAKVCAACHRLFEEGGELGPDLTGSDRGNLDYLLNNIIDPSASVAADYRLTIATTQNGRVVAGALVESDRSGIVIRTLQGEERLAKDEVVNRRLLKTSLMPEGLLQSLSDDEVIDLIGHLRSRVSRP